MYTQKYTQKLAKILSGKVSFFIFLVVGLCFAHASFTHSAKAEITENGARAVVGKPAPNFTLTDSNGKVHELSSYKGKFVVLEWFNQGCPFVRKHYESGNMQKLQKEYTKKSVIWLSICSSAADKQGNFSHAEHNAMFKEKNAAPTAILIDETGAVGHLYGAKTTPHMFVINSTGIIVYAGAIDDKPGYDQAEIVTAKNYVKAALDESMAGKPVTTPITKSYGCSVKY